MFSTKKLKEIGWSYLNDKLEKKICIDVEKEFLKFKKKKENINLHITKNEIRLWQAEKYLKNVKKIFNNKIIKNVENELGIKASFAIINLVSKGKFGSGGSWHRDTRFQNQYKIIFYITNCKKKNGPFEYINGSHKLLTIFSLTRIIDIFRKPRYEFLNFLLINFGSKIIGNRGCGVISNTKGIHRGSPLCKGTRIAVTIYFNHGVNLKKNAIFVKKK